jgi:hypothetical protein
MNRNFKYEMNQLVKCIKLTPANHEGLEINKFYTIVGMSEHDDNQVYAVRDYENLYYSIDLFEAITSNHDDYPEIPADIEAVKEVITDAVNPTHYKTGRCEVIDIIEDATATLRGIQATDTGNVIKYILRFPHKNGLEDLKKSAWYLNHLIADIERNGIR